MFESDGKVGQILQACFSPAPKNVVLQFRRRFFFVASAAPSNRKLSLNGQNVKRFASPRELTEKPSLSHSEKLPTLGFVYS